MMKKSSFIALIMGTVSGVLFALGMCMALLPEWNAFQSGVVCGLLGAVVLIGLVLVRRKQQGKALHISGKLAAHIEEIDRVAAKMFDRVLEQLKARDGITEELKAQQQMEWVRRMNAIRNEAEAAVMGELIYE